MGDHTDFDRTDRPAYSQPPPKPVAGAPSIHDLVAADLIERRDFGLRKYGVPLQAGNGRNPLADLYAELLDAACYAKQAMIEWDEVQHQLYAHRGAGAL